MKCKFYVYSTLGYAYLVIGDLEVVTKSKLFATSNRSTDFASRTLLRGPEKRFKPLFLKMVTHSRFSGKNVLNRDLGRLDLILTLSFCQTVAKRHAFRVAMLPNAG